MGVKSFLFGIATQPLKRTALRMVFKRALFASIPAFAAVVASPVSWAFVLGCLLVAFALPLLAIVPLRKLVAKKSNGVNAALLGTLTLVDVTCGLCAVGWSVDGWVASLVVLSFIVGGLFYNVWLLSFSDRLGA